MAKTATRTKAATKPAPEPVEDDFEDLEDEAADETDAEDMEDGDDLDEVEDSDEAEVAEKPKRKPPVRPKIAFGSPELAAHVTEVTGQTFDSRAVRMLLRKLAKDGKLARTIGEDKARYEFTGPEDPTVKLVVAMVKSGEAKALKQEGLDKVKTAAAAKKAAKKAAAEAAAAEAEEDGEEMDEVEEAPKPRRKTATKPAPAKATPAKRTVRKA
jgi:hypothetical protein